MGKVVRTLATVGIAVGAIALAAPTGGLSLAAAFSLTGVAATAIGIIGAAAFSYVATLALNTVLPPPRAAHNASGTSRVLYGFGVPPPPSAPRMPPREQGWTSAIFWPWQRRAATRSVGNCLEPRVSARDAWLIVDRDVPIERSDLFVLNVHDERTSSPDHWNRLGLRRAEGMCKQFDGITPDGVVLFSCTNPPARMETGADNLIYAHKVIGWGRTRREAWRSIERSEYV